MNGKLILESDVLKIRRQVLLTGLGISTLFCLLWFGADYQNIMWMFKHPTNLVTTDGMIIKSEMEFRGGVKASGWYFDIQYVYEVNGKSYTSNRVDYYYVGSSDIDFAKGYLKKYPLGLHVQVYYDPLHPEKSVLEPEVKEYDFLWYGGFGLLFGIFLASLGFLLKRRTQML